jgi:hypothetical protein
VVDYKLGMAEECMKEWMVMVEGMCYRSEV